MTLFGVAAVVVEVDEVESVSCTAPTTLVLPATIETVEVPDAVDTDAGDVPMTALT